MAADTVEIRLSGAGGQGLVLGARVLSEALLLEHKTVAQSQSYEPVSRGGVSRSDLVVSSGAIDYPLVTELDLLIILDQIAVEVSQGMIAKEGIVLVDAARVPAPPEGGFRLYSLPFTDKARELGNPRVANMLALGAGAALSEVCKLASLEQAIRSQLSERFWDVSIDALREGHALSSVLGGQAR